jgi:predicted DNA-binding protein
MREKMTETITVRLSETMKAELQALADADSRKLASYLTLVLQRHIAEKRGEKLIGEGLKAIKAQQDRKGRKA